MNWENPKDRAALIEEIGAEAYNRAFDEHIKESTVTIVGGHAIRPVPSRFGQLWQCGNTGRAFQKIEAAKTFAAENPVPKE